MVLCGACVCCAKPFVCPSSIVRLLTHSWCGYWWWSQKYLVVVFLVMTVVSLPVLVIFNQGQRMPESVPDPLGVSLLSLGNAGDPTSERIVQDNSSASVFTTSNVTTTDVWGWQLTAIGASYLVSFCDFLYTWVFIVFLLWLRARIRAVERHTSKHVRASDFTVYVRSGLPKVCASPVVPPSPLPSR